jgi:hypothetical protein
MKTHMDTQSTRGQETVIPFEQAMAAYLAAHDAVESTAADNFESIGPAVDDELKALDQLAECDANSPTHAVELLKTVIARSIGNGEDDQFSLTQRRLIMKAIAVLQGVPVDEVSIQETQSEVRRVSVYLAELTKIGKSRGYNNPGEWARELLRGRMKVWSHRFRVAS